MTDNAQVVNFYIVLGNLKEVLVIRSTLDKYTMYCVSKLLPYFYSLFVGEGSYIFYTL